MAAFWLAIPPACQSSALKGDCFLQRALPFESTGVFVRCNRICACSAIVQGHFPESHSHFVGTYWGQVSAAHPDTL